MILKLETFVELSDYKGDPGVIKRTLSLHLSELLSLYLKADTNFGLFPNLEIRLDKEHKEFLKFLQSLPVEVLSDAQVLERMRRGISKKNKKEQDSVSSQSSATPQGSFIDLPTEQEE